MRRQRGDGAQIGVVPREIDDPHRLLQTRPLQRDVALGGDRGAGGERVVDLAPQRGDADPLAVGDGFIGVAGDNEIEQLAPPLDLLGPALAGEFARARARALRGWGIWAWLDFR